MAGGAACRSPWSEVREAPQRLGAELATDGQGEAPSGQAQELAGGADRCSPRLGAGARRRHGGGHKSWLAIFSVVVLLFFPQI
jgi:hypothetical protein